MSAFDAALTTGDVARFNMVIPNDCENGHDRCGTHDSVRQFDDFLAREVPKIQASPAFGADGLIIVVWDEGADPPLARCTSARRCSARSVKPGAERRAAPHPLQPAAHPRGRIRHHPPPRPRRPGQGHHRHLAAVARAGGRRDRSAERGRRAACRDTSLRPREAGLVSVRRAGPTRPLIVRACRTDSAAPGPPWKLLEVAHGLLQSPGRRRRRQSPRRGRA